MLKSLKTFDLKDKRVLIRVDFNVPIQNDRVRDDFRIKAALPTIKYCLNAGANIVLMSHLGRPKGKINPELSLIPVGESLADQLEMPIKFSDDCVSEDAHNVSLGLRGGEVHLLENLRFHPEETKNDPMIALISKYKSYIAKTKMQDEVYKWEFVKKYKNKIINIHPALLPAFPGLNSQKQALDYGAKYSGCTVHFVDAGMDTGAVIIQAIVEIKNKDTEKSLSKKILKEEHRIYPQAVSLFARKKIKVLGRKTIIS